MKVIYIAGPYTKGDVAQNVRAAIDVADKLALHGLLPYVPMLCHFWHLVHPHEVGFWYEMDLAWLKRCDAVLRLPGESVGADAEVKRALEIGLPVYESVEQFLEDAR